MPALHAADWLLLIASPFVGSFVGVAIRRLPQGESIVRARSRCPHCGTTLTARDLLPLASWAAAGGRCRHCGAALGGFYPGVELACVGLAVTSLCLDSGLDAWIGFALGCWLLALAWIDADRGILPDVLTLPLIAFGLAAAALRNPYDLLDRIAGAVVGYLAFRVVAWAYQRLRRQEGLGGGDAKLLAAAGAWVGLSGLPAVVFGAAAIALVAAGLLAMQGRAISGRTALPFGPFLAIAAWLVWLFGPWPL